MRILLIIFCLLCGVMANAQETKTSMGFVLSPHFSDVHLINEGVNQGQYDSYDSLVNGSIGFSGNMFFQYELNEKLFCTWGLGIQNYSFQIKTPNTIEYTSKSIYRQYYLRLSASVKYRFYQNLYARAGVGVDVLAESREKFIAQTPSGENVHKSDDFSNYRETIVPIIVGIGYELKLSEKWNLMSELYGSLAATDALYKGSSTGMIQRKPWQVGISLGFIRSF